MSSSSLAQQPNDPRSWTYAFPPRIKARTVYIALLLGALLILTYRNSHSLPYRPNSDEATSDRLPEPLDHDIAVDVEETPNRSGVRPQDAPHPDEPHWVDEAIEGQLHSAERAIHSIQATLTEQHPSLQPTVEPEPEHAASLLTSTTDVEHPSPSTTYSTLGTDVRKALVVGVTKTATPFWLLKVPKDWTIYRYVVDDPTAEYTVPKNEGREAMIYLTYIIDNYDNLPEFIVFAHGEYRSWHQPEPFTYILAALNLTAVAEHGWVNLRCTLEPSCTKVPVDSWAYTDNWSWWSFVLRAMFAHMYKEDDAWYPPDLETINDPYPMKIPYSFASPCCAQFAVTKAAVLSKPRQFWIRAREPLLFPKDKWAPDLFEHLADSWHLGVGYERLWHYFFGAPAHTCLDEDYCRNVIYQGRIHCDRDSKAWGPEYESIQCDLLD